MKSIVLIALLTIFGIFTVSGQIKIGDNPQNIDPSSVLELESTSRVLVITRVNTVQMEAITPQRGGVVYNTDTECLHYFDGVQWVNLCDAVSFNLTNDPIENITSTISIVDNGTAINLEVAPNSIRSENIVDGGINGDDIQDNSIGESKLGDDSVSSNELRDNSVGSSEIRDGSIQPTDIASTVPGQVLTTDENGIVLWQDASGLQGATGDEITITGAGTVADPLTLTDAVQNSINDNTVSIATHILDDADTDDQNETLTDVRLEGNNLILIESGIETTLDLGPLNNSGTDNQNLNLTGNNLEIERGNTVNLNGFLDNTDEQQLSIAGNTISLTNGGSVNLPPGTIDTDEQQLSIVGNTISLTNGGSVDLPAGTVNTDNQDLSLTGNTINISGGAGVDLTPILGGGATDGVVSNVVLAGTNLNFTGIGGGFNGSVNLAGLGGGTGSTEEADQTTITGIGTNADPFKIEPGVPGSFLTTDAGGIVTWTNAGPGGGSTELADGTTILGLGTATDQFRVGSIGSTQITDASIGVIDIAPAAAAPANTQVLTTSTTGIVTWTDFPTGGTDTQQLTLEPGNLLTLTNDATPIDLTSFLDDQVANEVTVAATPVNYNAATADVEAHLTGIDIALLNAATPNLADVLTTGNSAGNSQINDLLDPTLPQDAATRAYVETRIATILAAGGVDGVVTNAFLTETEINFTGANGGFNGTFDLNPIFATDVELTDAIAASDALDLDIDPNNEIELPDDATATAGQILATNVDGTYAWVDDQTGTATIVSTDADQILTVGTDTGALLTNAAIDATFATDADVTTAIAASDALDLDIDPNNEIELPDDATATAGQILATNVDGTYAWVDDQTGTATIVSTDADQILTVGTDTGALLTNAAIDATFATDADVTTAIAASDALDLDIDPNNEIELPDDATATAGQILATNVDGTYAWVDDQTGTATIVSTDADQILTVGTDTGALLTNAAIDATFATDADVTTAIAASDALDLDIDPNNEIELPDDATATAGQILATNVDGTYAWVDDQTGTATIVSTDADQILTVGTDTGALLTNAAIDATFATDADVTTAIAASDALDLDIDPNNEIELPDDATATAGQILATNVDGTYAWVDDQTTAGTIVSTDANNAITPGTVDGGAFYDDSALTTVTAANAAAIIANTTAIGVKEDAANKSSDGTLFDNSDVDFPTEQAVKTYVDTQIGNITAGDNLSNADLTQTGGDRTYDLDENNLTFDITNSTVAFIGTTSNFGIGIPNPEDKLDVDGQIRARNGFASTEGSANNPGYGFYTNGDTNMGMYRIAADQLGFSTDATEALRIDASQNVGIGPSFTTNAIAARLHVDGNIRAEGTIQASGTITENIPDYVFQKYFTGTSVLNDAYTFKSLEEIEQFVKNNNNLPGIQSAAAIKKQGFWDLGEASRINLEKIEELFLHTIAQEKKIEQLNTEKEALSQKLERLEKDMNMIKQLLQTKKEQE
ncbi:beta strand repeat-containing protein [Maribacter sp. R77961]|uniref:beta strand repeat-containing protein n=1 Tax=Maribacter sp. R77961 TaxID=3093871 RepID=UPI0037C8796A